MMLSTIKRYPIVIASALHIVLLAALVISFEYTTTRSPLGEQTAAVVQSYVYQKEITSGAHAVTAKMKTKSVLPKQQASLALQQAQQQQSSHSTVTPININHGTPATALIALLHAAIQENQYYPPAAVQLEREGKVTVKFMLYPDGRVSDVAVIASSGTSSLDEAAITAVRVAAPFSGVQAYVTKAQVYNIDVVFQLT